MDSVKLLRLLKHQAVTGAVDPVEFQIRSDIADCSLLAVPLALEIPGNCTTSRDVRIKGLFRHTYGNLRKCYADRSAQHLRAARSLVWSALFSIVALVGGRVVHRV
jgi:hypothetical protein